MTRRIGQLITRMTGDAPALPKEIQIYTSNVKEVGLEYDKPWETIVIDPVARQQVPEFFEMGYTLHTDDLQQRVLHHLYVVGELQKLGYRVVFHQDDFQERKINEEYEALMEGLNAILVGLEEQYNIRTWNKRLEGIPGLDFTPEEWKRLEFLKHLYNQENLTR